MTELVTLRAEVANSKSRRREPIERSQPISRTDTTNALPAAKSRRARDNNRLSKRKSARTYEAFAAIRDPDVRHGLIAVAEAAGAHREMPF